MTMTPRPQTGVTLIELLVTLSIAVILMAIAVPGFQDFFRRNRVDSAASEFVAALNYARSEAIRRGVRVSVCGSSNPSAASPTCGDDKWAEGWVVFVDNSHLPGNASGVFDEGQDEVLRVSGPLPGGGSFSGGGNFARAVSYLASGISQGIKSGGTTGLANGTLTICKNSYGRQIAINNTGRVSVNTHTCT